MMEEDWSRLERLFDQALQIAPDHRSGFLAEIGRQSPTLRNHLERLIAADSASPEFMEQPVVGHRRDGHPTDVHSPDVYSPDVPLELDTDLNSNGLPTFGPFEILETLGRGGMGTVYLARQTQPVKRLVALKSILPERMSRESALRFQAEQQALARMSHPNIAQVYEIGSSPNGHPFLVMEYVPGVSLTEYCDRRRLGLVERLRLFNAVCSGVHHLHQRAVIHRDLKPSNILVSEAEEPVPKIIDFGIAKSFGQPLVDDTLETLGMLIGTPAFLSPEAVRAAFGDEGSDVDIRTDVYSLGVLLYQLLAGTLPFNEMPRTVQETLKAKLDIEPTRPSKALAALEPLQALEIAHARGLDPASLVRDLEVDLDWVVLKAMAADRDLRYASAEHLRAEVTHYLAGLPVDARPPSIRYRLRKFVKRHAVPVLALGAVIGALGTGTYLRSVEARRANIEATRAAQEAQNAREVVGFLIGTLKASDPFKSGTSDSVTIPELLNRAEGEVHSTLGAQPMVDADLLHTIGDVHCSLGHLSKCTALHRRALNLRRRHVPAESLQLADSLEGLASPLLTQGRLDEAEAVLQEAMDIRRSALGDDAPELASLHYRWSALYLSLGDHASAEQSLARAQALADSVGGVEAEEAAALLDILAKIYDGQGRPQDAEPLARASLAINRRAFGPRHPKVGKSLHVLGTTLLNQGRAEEAEPMLVDALTIQEGVLGDRHPRVADTLHSLTETYLDLKDFERAEQLERRALSIVLEVHGPNTQEAALVYNSLGEIHRLAGRLDQATDSFHRAIEAWRAALGPHHFLVAAGYNNLGLAFLDLGRLEPARDRFEKAMAILTETMGPDHPYTSHAMVGLARVYRQDGNPAAAVALLERAVAIWQRTGYHHPKAESVDEMLSELRAETSADLPTGV